MTRCKQFTRSVIIDYNNFEFRQNVLSSKALTALLFSSLSIISRSVGTPIEIGKFHVDVVELVKNNFSFFFWFDRKIFFAHDFENASFRLFKYYRIFCIVLFSRAKFSFQLKNRKIIVTIDTQVVRILWIYIYISFHSTKLHGRAFSNRSEKRDRIGSETRIYLCLSVFLNLPWNLYHLPIYHSNVKKKF